MADQRRESAATGDGEGLYGRRTFLAGGGAAVVSALTLGAAEGQTIAGAQQGKQDASATNPGPENQLLRQANPNTFSPPSTDHGEVRTFWASFSTAHRRIQEGGWSRQVNVESFPLSTEIAGVNMRLTAGGIRELHWHDAAEWAMMLSGTARLTAIDNAGKSYVKDVAKDDLWYFPSGTPHSIQGLGPDGCEFLLVFDNGKFSEGNTTLLSDWARHTPPEVLAKNWGVPESALEAVYKQPADGHYIFQAPVPPPLEQDVRAASGGGGSTAVAFDFAMHKMPPTAKTEVRRGTRGGLDACSRSRPRLRRCR